MRDGEPVLTKLVEIEIIDDVVAKPAVIQNHIGRRPIAAFGNSDGDLAMLQWTTAGKGARFAMLVHHTDPAREWAYDRTSSIGQFDKALDEANAKGWTVVDMKNDWRRIFPFQTPPRTPRLSRHPRTHGSGHVMRTTRQAIFMAAGSTVARVASRLNTR
jgi:hypothetical protein